MTMIINENGELVKLGKLNEFDVAEIRTLFFAENVSMKQLAKDFHTSISNIYKILNRNTWNK